MRIGKFTFIGALTLALGFAGTASAEDWTSPVEFINIGGASVGTVNYQLAIKFADMWSQIPGLTATAVPGSSVGNTRDIGLDRMQIGMTSMKTQYESVRGIGGYDKYEDLRYVLPWMLAHVVWVVRADSDIHSLSDLEDKHVMPGAEGSTSQEVGLLMLESVGITRESIRASGGQLSFGAVGNNITMMQDGQLDAMVITIPRRGTYTPIMPIEETVGIRFVPMEQDTLDYVLEQIPSLTQGHVEGGIYKNIPEEYHTVAEGFAFTARADLPEELVYRLTKMVWENADEIVAVNPHFFVYEDIEGALDMANVPLHPGAARYYAERGVDIPEELLPED